LDYPPPSTLGWPKIEKSQNHFSEWTVNNIVIKKAKLTKREDCPEKKENCVYY